MRSVCSVADVHDNSPDAKEVFDTAPGNRFMSEIESNLPGERPIL